MGDSLFLNGKKIHSDWFSFLTNENRSLVANIETEVKENGFTPSAENVLRFLSFPLSSAKVIILGQDPYPQPGAATGRAFEVGTLKSWNQPFKNISLKNILRTLYKAYTGGDIKFSQLKEKFDNEFPVLPPGKLFSHWEKQGVLLLNTSFTCEPGKPGSHQKKWEEFACRLLPYIRDNAPLATWFLWGNHAQAAAGHLHLKRKIETMHPMMCYNKPGRDTDFLFGKVNCFEPFVGEIDWTGFGLNKGIKNVPSLFQ
ncbi:Uracil-DNA glycosylase [Mariniphaga anaerophila]|uniref:Uracil-DNA glycosylase n=1 Tax=Mariniphaga anaerophila TaxID=1484053 RepID=A0A1M4T9X2_9BACT|nr:uracil-DNA glycosylase [Mariniphaga anaerophila]SHE41283.1 Uracil-DNA glycosylase [Mariniphaga anaerophila]